MYLDHYHLNTKPFDLSPRPEFLWLGEKHDEALATLKYGIKDDLGFLLLTGDVGVGKTALIHRLLSHLDSSTIVAHITDPGLGTFDFFKLLAVEFNIPTEFYSKGDFLIELEKFLHQAHADHKKVLLVVDEAQRLNNKLLDQIRVLSNIELSDRKLINIFLVGQPEFKTMLMANSNRALLQRIAINYHIQPLTESETGQYIDHRLEMAGATRKIFKSNATREIHRFTGGFPRAINIICDHALVTGYISGLKTIDSDVIEECEQELNIRAGFDFSRTALKTPTQATRPKTPTPTLQRPERPTQTKNKGALILLGICIVLVTFTTYYLLRPDPSRTMDPNTPEKLAASSSDPPDTATKEQTQASSENAVVPASTDTKNGPQDEAAPKDEIAAADGQQDPFKTQTGPASDQFPAVSEVDSGVDVPGKSEEAVASLSALPDAQPEPQPNEAAQDEIATADRQTVISTAQTTPATEQSTDTSEVGSDVDVPSQSKEALASLSALLDDQPEPQPNEAAQDETDTADRQTVVPTAQTTPATELSTDTSEVGSDVDVPGKSEEAVASLSALPDAQPEPQPNEATQDASPPKDETTVADGQTAISADPATSAPGQSSTNSAVGNDVNGSDQAGKTVAVVAALPEAKPNPQPDKEPQTSNSAGKAPTTESKKEAPASSSDKTTPENQTPAEKTTQPDSGSSDTPPAPPLTAKAETQPQPSSQPIGGSAQSVNPPGKNDLENRLRSFLQNYCNTYAAKDLDAFTNLFIPDARENGTPFIRLIPKYQKNFDFIETIEYRIELQQFIYDEEMGIVEMDGNFFLKWLPPDQKWRENAGTISMRLKEKGPSFLVQRLDYQGRRQKKE